jgi:hypothetical protein
MYIKNFYSEIFLLPRERKLLRKDVTGFVQLVGRRKIKRNDHVLVVTGATTLAIVVALASRLAKNRSALEITTSKTKVITDVAIVSATIDVELVTANTKARPPVLPNISPKTIPTKANGKACSIANVTRDGHT